MHSGNVVLNTIDLYIAVGIKKYGNIGEVIWAKIMVLWEY
jgi:hypothetical protein